MSEMIVFTIIVLVVLACLGLFMSGLAGLRQARLAKRMFRLRYSPEENELSRDSEPR